MSRSITARAVLTALALLAVAAPSAGAWSGRNHWRIGGGHSWLVHRDAGVRALPTGDGPQLSLVDPDTRTVYVTADDGTVTVHDASACNASRASGCDDPGVTVPTGAEAVGLALNDRTLYVTNVADGTMSIIDAARCNARNATGCAPAATVAVGEIPVGISVDPVTDTIYVGRPDHAAVSVIDGTTCNRSIVTGCAGTAAASLPGGVFPVVDAATRTLYVPGVEGTTMGLLDLRTCNGKVHSGCGALVATVDAGEGPFTAVVDPATRTVYVGNEPARQVSILNGATCNALVRSGCGQTPASTRVGHGVESGLALDRDTRTLYVPAAANDIVSAIDTTRCNARFAGGCGTRWPTLQTGNEPFWIDLDPTTGTLYVPDHLDHALAVLDARSCSTLRRSGCRDEAPSVFVDDAFSIALDREVNTTYITHANLHDLVMFDSSRCSARRVEACEPAVAPVAGISGPFDIAYGNHTLYATNQDDRTLVLIDPAKCNHRRPGGCAPVKTIRLPHAFNVGVDPVRHTVYVTAYDDDIVSVIDGRRCNARILTGCTPAAVPAGDTPIDAVADPVTGTLYVTNQQPQTVSVIAGGRTIATIAVGQFPALMAIDPALRKLYVANNSFDEPGSVSVIDIRACNRRTTSGCGNAAGRVPTGRGPFGLAVDPRSHRVYTTDLFHSTMTVIDGVREKRVDTIALGFFPWDVAVDTASDTVIATNNGEGTVAFLPTR
jgi:DNA-binding beta-propeller fold protein YncE